MADNRMRVTAPQGTPHRYGLLSVTAMQSPGSGHWVNGIEFDQTCGVGVKRAYVPCDTPPTNFVKEPLELSRGNEADALVLYAMVDCGFIGGGDDPELARAELAAGEARALEAEFALTAYANAGPPIGTTTDAAEALGALLASWDAGVMPTIHMSPNVAVLLGDRIVREGDGLYLRTGEQVSVGYGYAEGAAQNGINTGALFITGPVFGYSSDVIEGAAPRIVDNAAVTLAERVWLIASLCTTQVIILEDLADGVVIDGGGA
jgi:hypothetical protein